MNFDPSSGSDKFRLTLFLTPPHDCGYLSDRSASTLFVDPLYKMRADTYEFLLAHGFRRSGSQVYRPYCGVCEACIPVRIPASSFVPQRSFRRILKKNQDLTIRSSSPDYTDERFELYRTYIQNRHHDGLMANPSKDDFSNFLCSSWGRTEFVEFRLADRLIMVTVMDHQEESLSAVYTFFDPLFSSRSPGTLAVLWGVEEVRRLQKSWLYLGYWVEECRKMSYKSRFKPQEIYQDREWHLLT